VDANHIYYQYDGAVNSIEDELIETWLHKNPYHLDINRLQGVTSFLLEFEMISLKADGAEAIKLLISTSISNVVTHIQQDMAKKAEGLTDKIKSSFGLGKN
jgi:hypothetical protein